MKFYTNFLFLFVLFGCSSSKLPTKKISQYIYNKSYLYLDDSLKISLKNPLKCPLRIWIQTSNNELQTLFNQSTPITLKSEKDTIITYSNKSGLESKVNFASRLGSTSKQIKNIKLELPFKKGKGFVVVQGNNTNFTHNTDYSRYAVDFDLKVNDTICSATNGFVVGVIDKYKFGGKKPEWKDFGNFITIYEPNSGIFTQYVHLTENGSLVKLGDEIKQGQAIGLSGMTGQTYSEHLHFNCLVPVNNNDGLKSIPSEFTGSYKSTELKKGDLIEK